MAKIDLSNITSGYNLSKINENFQKVEDALNEEVLYRDNPEGEDNSLQTDLDANNKRILNLPDPVSASEPIRKQEWDQTVGLAEQYRDEAEASKDAAEFAQSETEDLVSLVGVVQFKGSYSPETFYSAYDAVFDYEEVLSSPGAWYLAPEAFTSVDIATDVAAGDLVLFQGLSRQTGTINLDSVSDIYGINATLGEQYLLKGFTEDSTSSASLLVAEIARHDGVKAISTSRSQPTDYSNQTQLDAWFLDSGSDELCLVRKNSDRVDIQWLGAIGDESFDETLLFKHAFENFKSLHFSKPVTKYRLDSSLDALLIGDIDITCHPDVRFTDPKNLPHVQTNNNHPLDHPALIRTYTEGTAAYGDVTHSFEAIASGTAVGNVVGSFHAARGNSGSSADIWAINTLTRADAGYTGIVQGLEVDIDVLGTPSEVFGINITGIGTLPSSSVCFNAARADGVSYWNYGYQALSTNTGFVSDSAQVQSFRAQGTSPLGFISEGPSIGFVASNSGEGFKSIGASSNAFVIVPPDDLSPDSVQLVLWNAAQDTLMAGLKNSGELMVQGLQFKSVSGTKIDDFNAGTTTLSVSVTASGHQQIVFDGTSGYPDVDASTTNSVGNVTLVNIPSGLMSSSFITSGGKLGVNIFNATGSTITASVAANYSVIARV